VLVDERSLEQGSSNFRRDAHNIVVSCANTRPRDALMKHEAIGWRDIREGGLSVDTKQISNDRVQKLGKGGKDHG